MVVSALDSDLGKKKEVQLLQVLLALLGKEVLKGSSWG